MKRFKIITTIASITLALAIMVFGVYAAGTVTGTVSQTISYTMNNVYVDITVTYKYGTSGSLSTQATYTGDTYTGEDAAKVERALTWSGGTAPAAWTYTYTAAAPVCEITIKIDNKNVNEGIKAKVSSVPGTVTNTSALLKHSLNGAAETTTAADTFYELEASTGTITFRYRRTLSDTSLTVGTGVSGWNPTITAQRL